MSSLPSAFYIQHLFEVKEALERVSNPKKAHCDKCGEGDVHAFCRDCGQFICQVCLGIHHKWKEYQNHEISSLDEVQETASKMVAPKKETTLCSRHPTEPINIYCETCSELICRDCTVKTHCDHSYDLISDAFPKHRDAILTCLRPIKMELANIVETITNLNTRSSRLDRQCFAAKAKVDNEFEVDKFISILEAHRRDLHTKIDGLVHQEKKELAAQIDQHELRQAQLSICVEFVESSLQSGSQEEVLSMKKQVEQRAQQMAAEFNPQLLKLSPEKILSVSCADLTPMCQTLANVIFKQVKFEGTHIKTISRLNRPRHIAFATTGEIVVCVRNANCVTVFSSSCRCLQSFGNTESEESGLSSPLGVAISSDNIVFVAADHCVKKFTLEGQFIASVGSFGNGKLEFDTPWAIAYNSTNNRLYVCDTLNYRITILNHNLTFCGSFGSKGSGTGQFNMPEGISVDRKGNVLVADRFNDRIQVFDARGHYLSSITQNTPGQQLQGPISVSVGPDDCVYVVEFDSDRVSIFSENGEYIKSFGNGGHDKEFNNPYAVAVAADGHVYVSDTDSNRIQIFK